MSRTVSTRAEEQIDALWGGRHMHGLTFIIAGELARRSHPGRTPDTRRVYFEHEGLHLRAVVAVKPDGRFKRLLDLTKV